MKLFITLSKRNLIFIFSFLIILIVVLGQVFTVKGSGIDGSDNTLRVEYINSLGYTVNHTAVSVKEITIPQTFSDVYTKYNKLQQIANFDLGAYKGKNATIYTYSLKDDEDIVVNLIVYKNSIIGGDISSVKIDGQMKPLIKE